MESNSKLVESRRIENKAVPRADVNGLRKIVPLLVAGDARLFERGLWYDRVLRELAQFVCLLERTQTLATLCVLLVGQLEFGDARRVVELAAPRAAVHHLLRG